MASRSPNENFMYNLMLASALSQLLPAEERKIIRSWIDKLYNITDGNEMVNRNDYMWYLLLTLQNKRVTTPFNAMPQDGELLPIKDIVPQTTYHNTVQSSATAANLAWIDHLLTRSGGGSDGSQLQFERQQRGGTTIPPSQFLNSQPLPRSGILCYMGAFSDQQKY